MNLTKASTTESVSSCSDTTSLSEESIDFNSEDAIFGVHDPILQTTTVEVLGLSLLMGEDPEEISDCSDESDSESDYSDEEIELRSEYSSPNRKTLGRRRRHQRGNVVDSDLYDGGETDSLILTRNRLPNLVHKDRSVRRLSALYKEGRGLMGEVDSLDLDRKRLSHLLNPRRHSHEFNHQARYSEFEQAVSKRLADMLIEASDSESESDSECDLLGDEEEYASATEGRNEQRHSKRGNGPASPSSFQLRQMCRSQSGARAA